MSAFNLPPGVSLNDEHINGNDPWEQVFDGISKDCDREAWSDMDCFVAWRLGMAAFKATKAIGGTFPHNLEDQGCYDCALCPKRDKCTMQEDV